MKRYYKLDNGSTGKVMASYARPQPHIEGLVYLEEPDSDLKSWNGSEWVEDGDLISKDYEKQVEETDSNYIRVIDDVINTLINKGTITLTDLPDSVQDKYNNRKTLREQI